MRYFPSSFEIPPVIVSKKNLRTLRTIGPATRTGPALSRSSLLQAALCFFPEYEVGMWDGWGGGGLAPGKGAPPRREAPSPFCV